MKTAAHFRLGKRGESLASTRQSRQVTKLGNWEPQLPIVDCRLPICVEDVDQLAIGPVGCARICERAYNHLTSKGQRTMADTIKCTHCGEKRPALGFAPLPNELGQRIAKEICQPCWSGWLQKQTQIINHYGLDLTTTDAQNFLFDNIKGFLFGEVPQSAEIDTTKEGSVKW
jgi:Fe-S cluster biosynthesis and repair protein YggX